MPRRAQAARALGWLLTVALSLWVLFLSGTYFGISHPVPKIGFDVLVGVAFVAALLRSLRSRSAGTQLLAPLMVLLGGQGIAAATAISPSLAWPRLGLAGSLVLLYAVLVRAVGDPWFRRRLASLAIGALTAGAILYVVDAALQWVTLMSASGRLLAPPPRPGGGALWFGAPQLAALFFAILAPVAYGFAPPSSRRERSLATLVAALVAVAIIVSAARSVWIGCAAGLITFLVLEGGSVRARVSVARLGRTGQRKLLVALAGLVGIPSLLLLPILIGRASLQGLELRVPLWETAVAAFVADPLTGIGPGNWGLWNDRHLAAGVPNLHLPHAHDMYLEALAEYGLLGVLAAVPLAARVASMINSGRRSSDPMVRRWATVAATAVAIYLGSQLTENSSNVPLALICLMVPVAVLDASLSARRTDAAPMPAGFGLRMAPGRRSWLALGMLAILVFGLRLRSDVIEWRIGQASGASARGDWGQAAVELGEAAWLDPALPIVQWSIALANARNGDPADALRRLEQVVTVDQHNQVLVDQAWLQIADGRDRQAILTARAALERTGLPDVRWQLADGVVAFNVGVIAERAGERSLATEAYARALVVDPSFAADDYWLDPARVVDRTSVLTQASALARASERLGPVVAADVWLEAGCARQAAAELSAARPGTDRTVRELVLEHAQRPALLRRELERLAQADPFSPAPVRWLARLAALQADAASLNRYRSWLGVLAPHNAAIVGTVRGSVPAPPSQRSLSSLDIVPVLIYQVESLPELLVPQAATIGQRLPTSVVGPRGLQASCP
ncbi:MAG TPA: O-antigen ligase family protein [Candidatus Limnocylindrales bacterium]|nr:O-antigen ligase family protein [Candidatus Limnocylindrales bacterium]